MEDFGTWEEGQPIEIATRVHENAKAMGHDRRFPLGSLRLVHSR